jgi:hypothetical protein
MVCEYRWRDSRARHNDGEDAMSEPRLPNLLIAGVGKAGTTSLFWYLSQHPDVCASAAKEPRYFRFPDDDPDAELPPIETYARHFVHCGAQRYVMEASPQYFKGGTRTITAIRRTLYEPRIILMFRDPLDRMWSEYRFRKSRLTLPESITFDAYVAECERVRDEGLPRTPETQAFYTLAGGAYADLARDWLDAFGDDIRVWFFEDMVADPSAFVAEVCRWLGIDAAPARVIDYTVENRTAEVRSRAMQRVALAANAEGGLLRNRRRLKAPLRAIYYAINRGSRRERMSPETRRGLEQTFAGPNAALAAELRRRGYRDLPGWLPRVRAGDAGTRAASTEP